MSKKYKEMLSSYYETDLDNCTMTNEMWIEELSKALSNPKKYKNNFLCEYALYQSNRGEVIIYTETEVDHG